MCPVFVGTAAGPLAPDPDEVAEAAWEPWQPFRAAVLDGTREVARGAASRSPSCPRTLRSAPAASWDDLPPAAKLVADGAGQERPTGR